MLKKWISLILIVMMLLTLTPFALAADEESGSAGGEITNPSGGESTNPAGGESTNPADGESTNPAGGESTNPAGGESTNPAGGEGTTPAAGEGTNPAGGEGITPAAGEGTNPAGGAKNTDTVTTTLTANGGTFPYDGKAHTVTYSLKNGEAYKNVYFSVDGGETWTKTAPSLTNPGKLTVTVRAVKEDGKDPLTVTVTLEVIEAAVEGSTVTIVNCDTSVNVRAKATSSSKKIGDAKKGKTYKLLAVAGNWYKIQYTSSTAGYVFHTYVKVGKSSDAPAGNVGTIVNVNTAVNIRAKASSDSKKLGTAVNGQKFKVLGVSGRWVKIEYKGGIAYVYDHYISYSGTPSPDPVTPVAGKKAYITNCNVFVNVRAKASSNSKKVGTISKGTEITVTGISGNWTRFKFNGSEAFVFTYYVTSAKPDDDVIGKKGTIVNCTSFVNVRAKASSSSKKLGTAKKGASYTVLGTSGNWIKVNYNGTAAFIYKRYVKIG